MNWQCVSQTDTRSKGTVAVVLLLLISVIFLLHPWFLPSRSDNFLLGLPVWYWLELGIMAVLYIIYYAFTTRMDSFYERLGVHK